MTVTAIANQKGGSAKTTTCVNVAAALGELGRRVLVVDLDPQGSASAWFGREAPPTERGLLDVFTANVHLSDLVAETDVAGVAVVPGSAWLNGVERAVAGDVGTETILRREVARLPATWDHVLIDCPPSLGFLAIAALVAADDAVVPVEAHTMALAGLASLVQTVDRVHERLNPALKITAILACRVDARTRLALDVVDQMRARFGALVLQTVVRENVRLAEAPSFSKPVTTYAPTSTGADDYRAVARELVARWQKKGKRR